jgi:hypothetical protein
VGVELTTWLTMLSRIDRISYLRHQNLVNFILRNDDNSTNLDVFILFIFIYLVDI